jgi:hypothetical protein
VKLFPVPRRVATRAGSNNRAKIEAHMTHYIGYDEDQEKHAVGTNPDDVLLEPGVEHVLLAMATSFHAVQDDVVSRLTIDVAGIQTACLEGEAGYG